MLIANLLPNLSVDSINLMRKKAMVLCTGLALWENFFPFEFAHNRTDL